MRKQFLLATGQKGYTVLGQLYGRVRLLEATFLNLYKFGEFNTPYLSQNDNRMKNNSAVSAIG